MTSAEDTVATAVTKVRLEAHMAENERRFSAINNNLADLQRGMERVHARIDRTTLAAWSAAVTGLVGIVATLLSIVLRAKGMQ